MKEFQNKIYTEGEVLVKENKLLKTVGTNKAPKVSDPIKYNRLLEKLNQFLNQLHNHFIFYPERFPLEHYKVLFIGIYLKDTALYTFLVYREHYDTIEEKDRDQEV